MLADSSWTSPVGSLSSCWRVPSGATFVRAIQEVLKPIKDFTDAYVDDMAIFSDHWYLHLKDLEEYLKVIQSSGITLNLKKCRFAQKEVKICGELIGGSRLSCAMKVFSNSRVPLSA